MKIRYHVTPEFDVEVDEWELEEALKYRLIHVERIIVGDPSGNIYKIGKAIANFENRKIRENKEKAESLLGWRQLITVLTLAATIFGWLYF